MRKIILYYRFTPLADPTLVRHWQWELCRRLQLRGRVIVAPQGINGTLGGELADLLQYKRALNEVPALRGIDYKWSAGSDDDFPKLSVKVRPELVTLAAENDFDVYDSSAGLSAQAWHQYLSDHPEAIVLDARNDYESQLGSFQAKNLIRPAIKSFKEIKAVVRDLPREEPILTYCTGDVRCEYLSAYMRDQGFAEVHHLTGGIIRYGQLYGDQGYWRGQCYVFDGRRRLRFSDASQDIASCLACRTRTSQQVNCPVCNLQIMVCGDCQQTAWQHCARVLV